MNKKLRYFIWFVIILLAIIPVLYSIGQLQDKTYLDSTMGNWLATMIGAFVGILIALELDRFQKNAADKNALKKQIAEEKKRKEKVLTLIRQEIDYNLKFMNFRVDDGEAKRSVVLPRLKDELWITFSDGGEMQWIKDLQLLDTLSSAYYWIRNVIYLEERFIEAQYSTGIGNRGNANAIREIIMNLDDAAVGFMKKAIKEIDNHLQ